MDPHYPTFGNSIRGWLVYFWSPRRDSISYYRHGVNGDNKNCVGGFYD